MECHCILYLNIQLYFKTFGLCSPSPPVLVLVGSYWGTQSAPLGSSRVRADPGVEPGPGIRQTRLTWDPPAILWENRLEEVANDYQYRFLIINVGGECQPVVASRVRVSPNPFGKLIQVTSEFILMWIENTKYEDDRAQTPPSRGSDSLSPALGHSASATFT